MENQLLFDYYKTAFLSLHCAMTKGKPNFAKPAILLSVIEAIEQGLFKDNIITADILKTLYQKQKGWIKRTPAPFEYPFVFLTHESFWHIQWKNGEKYTKCPHAKFIRDNIEYAYLDNALWDLLQDEKIRQEYKTTIENFFLK